jgi:hypothetical protein
VLVLIAAVLIAIANAAQPYAYMVELRAKEREVAAASAEGTPREKLWFALQMQGNARSFVGESELAGATYSNTTAPEVRTPEQRADAGRKVQEILANYVPRDAIAAIVEQARTRQIVILNEAHMVSRHRAFATLLALELRKLGFEYLAVETLDARAPERNADMRKRGYSVIGDGYYNREPLFGDFLRRSLAAGYQPVTYEFDIYGDEYQKLDRVTRQKRREEGQARNIVDRILVADPLAKILVYVGHGHVNKGLVDFDGEKISLMAEHLKNKSGSDPLCIDQVQAWRGANGERDRLLVDQVFAAFKGDSMVLASRQGPGFWNGGPVDIQVWHRPVTLRHGRAHWLSMNGYRKPRAIPKDLLPAQGRRLIQAFVDGESVDAVPMDQVLVNAGDPNPPRLMLPKGKYRFVTQD